MGVIDIFTFLGSNSEDYAEYLKYTCEKFSSGDNKFNWKCIKSVGSTRIPKGFKVVAKTGDIGHNSSNHGIAMNEALNHVETEQVVFIDADMAVVYKNWDKVVMNELNETDCFGVAYGHSVKYKNFPTVYFFSFNSYILEKAKLDFRPTIKKGSEAPLRYKINEKESTIFGIRAGGSIKCDTGWKLPLIIKNAGFDGKAMPMVLMTSKKAQLPFEDKAHRQLCLQKPNHMCEWHYKGKVFTTHKQASRTQPLKEKWGNAWKRRIDLYIKRGV